MNRYALLFFAFLSLLMTSCKDKNAVTLKEKLQSEYTRSDKVTNLSSGSKVQYMQMEKSINQQYIKELDSLVNTAFVRQLERFEDEELGVLSSYKNMFSWLFKSRQSWDDAMIVMSNKYFNSLDVSQEQHALYLEYVKDIKEIRQQFLSVKGLPSYTQIDLPSETITLDAFSNHSRNNLVIEFGTELFGWFLGFVLVQIILLFVDKTAGPWWKIQCKLPPKTKRFCPLVLK
ncbi:MAG: hypothetical protein ACLST5_14135 [Bacteroides uniformis]|jgi:hypothetical protein|uniref:hypothetical protein n=1 Tax=Bacteroides uniformis TaxID=820 RepID=UPI003219792D